MSPTVLDMQGLRYLTSLSVHEPLSRLHVETIHLAGEGGQEVQDQTVFGHLQRPKQINHRSDENERCLI